MEFRLTSRHLEVTEGIRSRAQATAQKLAEEFEQIASVQMTLEVEKYRQIAQLEARTPGGRYYAREESDDMYVSIDQAAKKLANQIRRKLDRQIESGRQGARRALETETSSEPEREEPPTEEETSPGER